MSPGFHAAFTPSGTDASIGPPFGISSSPRSSPHRALDTGRSHLAIFAMIVAAADGVAMFSFPAKLSCGRIIFRCSFTSGTPRARVVAFTFSMPTRSMSMFVAVLSDTVIMNMARSPNDNSLVPSPRFWRRPLPPVRSARRTGTRVDSLSVPASSWW